MKYAVGQGYNVTTDVQCGILNALQRPQALKLGSQCDTLENDRNSMGLEVCFFFLITWDIPRL